MTAGSPTPIDFLVPFDALIAVHRSLEGGSWSWHCLVDPNSAMCFHPRTVITHEIALERAIEHLERSHHIMRVGPTPTVRTRCCDLCGWEFLDSAANNDCPRCGIYGQRY